MINRAVSVAAVAGLAGVIVAGGSAVASAASTDQGTRTYHVTQHSNVVGAGHLRPGLVRIKITGHRGHSLQIVSSRHGGGRATLAADANAFSKDGNAGKLEHDFRFLGGAEAGGTLFVYLKPGRYFLADTDSDSLSARQVKVVRVSGHASHAAGYAPTGTLRAIHEMTWSNSPKRIPAKGLLRFDNRSSDTHFVVMARLKPGKHLSDVRKLLKGEESQAAVLYGGRRSNFDNGVVSPGRTETVSYDLHPGRYVIACFWPDENGVPHAAMGMIRTITLV